MTMFAMCIVVAVISIFLCLFIGALVLIDWRMAMVFFVVVIATCVIVLQCGCGTPLISRTNNTAFSLPVTGQTPAGYPVSDPKSELDLERVDRMISEVSACVAEIAPLSTEDYSLGDCLPGTMPQSLDDYVIAVAPEWRTSPCSGEQVFTCDVDVRSCLAKGQIPTADCPCSCRGTIQNRAIVVTPNLKLLGAELVNVMLNCTDALGGSTELARCSDVE